jgi:hypothetical protein
MNATAEAASAEVGKASAKKKAEIEIVEMQDGRKVEFAGKRKLLKDTILDKDGDFDHVLLDFRNGETRKIKVNASLIGKFIGHGVEQKYGDETAGEDDVDDMVIAIDELDGNLQKGVWSTRVPGTGFAGTSVLMKALIEKSGKTIEQVKNFLTGKSQAEKLALRNSPQLKPIVERLEAEKVSKAAKVDTNALLAGLDVA